jgi:hypothetical protein
MVAFAFARISSQLWSTLSTSLWLGASLGAPFFGLAHLHVFFFHNRKNKKTEVEKSNVVRNWKGKKLDEMWEEIKQKPNSNCQNWKTLKMREEVWG